jgi:pimeloyl-ACP methyl ester carboxylesterase
MPRRWLTRIASYSQAGRRSLTITSGDWHTAQLEPSERWYLSPTLLVGHSYGGSVISEAGIHPKIVGLVYVAAHAPDVGEDEATLGRKTPSILARTDGAIRSTSDGFPKVLPEPIPSESHLIAR